MNLIRSFALFLSLTLLFSACEDPIKDISLHISPRMYNYVMEVEMHDFANPDAPYTGEVQIEITGPDANKIYNVDGTKNYEAKFGRLLLITNAANEPIDGDPLEFTVKISSGEYMDKELNFLVENGQTYSSLDAFLINRTNLPQGLVSSGTSASLNANGQLDQPLQFSTNPAGSAEALIIDIPTGVKFTDASGNVISGSNLNVEVISYDQSRPAVNLAMPNNGINAEKVNGEIVLSFIPPAGSFEINMDIDGTEVKGFSGSGINLSMPLAPGLENPLTQQAYAAGDEVNLISFSTGDPLWQAEGKATVVVENGKAFVKPNITHLSNYATTPVTINNDQVLVVDNVGDVPLVEQSWWINELLGGVNLKFLIMMENFSGKILDLSDKDYLDDGSVTLNFSYEPGLKVTDQIGDFILGGGAQEPSAPASFLVSVSGNTVTYDPKPNPVHIGYTLRCKGEEATYTPPFGSKVSYRPAGSSEEYKDIYTFTFENAVNRLHTLNGLEDGKTYDFKLNWSTMELYQTSLTMEDGKIYELELTEKECDDIGFKGQN